jgi:hypothetical protein
MPPPQPEADAMPPDYLSRVGTGGFGPIKVEDSKPVFPAEPLSAAPESSYPRVASTFPASGDFAPAPLSGSGAYSGAGSGWADPDYLGPNVRFGSDVNQGYVPNVFQQFDGYSGDTPQVIQGKELEAGNGISIRESSDINTGGDVTPVQQGAEPMMGDDMPLPRPDSVSPDGPEDVRISYDDTVLIRSTSEFARDVVPVQRGVDYNQNPASDIPPRTGSGDNSPVDSVRLPPGRDDTIPDVARGLDSSKDVAPVQRGVDYTQDPARDMPPPAGRDTTPVDPVRMALERDDATSSVAMQPADSTERAVLMPVEPLPPPATTPVVPSRPVTPDDDVIVLGPSPGVVVGVPPKQGEPPKGRYSDYIVDRSTLKPGYYYVQIATMSDLFNIDNILARFGDRYPFALVPSPASKQAYQVLVGPLKVDEYGVVLARFQGSGFNDAFLRQIK